MAPSVAPSALEEVTMADPIARPLAPPVDLLRAREPLGAVLPGLGLTPAAARQRAAVVRAVTEDSHIRQRPMPVVIVTGVVALIALAIWAWQLYVTLSDETPLTPLFWAALATFLVASAICSWAWQLYDVRKAIVMWLAIVVLTVAAAIIIAVVLAAFKGDSDADMDLGFDLDSLVHAITGEQGRDTGFVDHVVAPVVFEALDTMGGGSEATDGVVGDSEPPVEVAPAGVPACPSCGRAQTPGLLVCPRCGTSLG
jgi:hypothetical protein